MKNLVFLYVLNRSRFSVRFPAVSDTFGVEEAKVDVRSFPDSLFFL